MGRQPIDESLSPDRPLSFPPPARSLPPNKNQWETVALGEDEQLPRSPKKQSAFWARRSGCGALGGLSEVGRVQEFLPGLEGTSWGGVRVAAAGPPAPSLRPAGGSPGRPGETWPLRARPWLSADAGADSAQPAFPMRSARKRVLGVLGLFLLLPFSFLSFLFPSFLP